MAVSSEELEQRVRDALSHVRAAVRLFGGAPRRAMSADDFQAALLHTDVLASILGAASIARDCSLFPDGLDVDVTREARRFASLMALAPLVDKVDRLGEALRAHFSVLFNELDDVLDPAYAPLAQLGKTKADVFHALRGAREILDPSDDESQADSSIR
jgi:hypothetical protein